MKQPLNKNDPDPSVTTSKAAKLLGISQRTVHYWMERGVIRFWKTAGGHCRIPMSSISQLLEERKGELLERDNTILTILLVEDDENLREVSKTIIVNWDLPINLIVAENGFEGLIQAGLSKPDVIITDLMMPSMDGFQMIKVLRVMPGLNKPRIVVVTAIDDQHIVAKGGVADDIELLRKPIPYEHLKSIVLEVLSYHSRGKFALREWRDKKTL